MRNILIKNNVGRIVFEQKYQKKIPHKLLGFKNTHAGASNIILTCNMPHCFLQDICYRESEANDKILNIIEVSCSEIVKNKEK